MIGSRIGHYIECDCCGDKLRDENYDILMFDTEKQAKSYPLTNGWNYSKDGNHYCPDCDENLMAQLDADSIF